MFKLRFLALALVLLPFLSFSQNDFRKGYVVTLKGDTLKGYVGGKEYGITLKEVRFKTDSSAAAVQKFSVEDCTAFGLYGRDAYERYTVKISLGKLNVDGLSSRIDTTTKREAVFLQLMQKGKNVSLYNYTDEIKTRFYIKDKTDAQPAELMYYRYYAPGSATQMVERTDYQQQLLLLLRKYNVAIDDFRLERSNYDDNDMLRLVSLINDYKKEKSKYKVFTFYAGAGLAYPRAKYVGEHVLVGDGVNSKNPIVPFVAAGVDIYLNPAYQRTFFRLELEAGLTAAKYSFEKEREYSFDPNAKHRFKQISGVLTASLLRNFYNADNCKVYAGLGLGLRYAKTTDNVRTDIYTHTAYEKSGLDFKKINLQMPIAVGVILNKKIDVSFVYVLPNTITDNYTLYNIELNKVRLGVNYRF